MRTYFNSISAEIRRRYDFFIVEEFAPGKWQVVDFTNNLRYAQELEKAGNNRKVWFADWIDD